MNRPDRVFNFVASAYTAMLLAFAVGFGLDSSSLFLVGLGLLTAVLLVLVVLTIQIVLDWDRGP